MAEITPYLCVSDAKRAINWYVDVLGAEVTYDPIIMDDGRVGHVELCVQGARMMMSDEFTGAGVQGPAPDRGAAVSLHLGPVAVDALTARAEQQGARVDRAPEDTEHGRVAVVTDPFGHRWFLNNAG